MNGREAPTPGYRSHVGTHAAPPPHAALAPRRRPVSHQHSPRPKGGVRGRSTGLAAPGAGAGTGGGAEVTGSQHRNSQPGMPSPGVQQDAEQDAEQGTNRTWNRTEQALNGTS